MDPQRTSNLESLSEPEDDSDSVKGYVSGCNDYGDSSDLINDTLSVLFNVDPHALFDNLLFSSDSGHRVGSQTAEDVEPGIDGNYPLLYDQAKNPLNGRREESPTSQKPKFLPDYSAEKPNEAEEPDKVKNAKIHKKVMNDVKVNIYPDNVNDKTDHSNDDEGKRHKKQAKLNGTRDESSSSLKVALPKEFFQGKFLSESLYSTDQKPESDELVDKGLHKKSRVKKDAKETFDFYDDNIIEDVEATLLTSNELQDDRENCEPTDVKKVVCLASNKHAKNQLFNGIRDDSSSLPTQRFFPGKFLEPLYSTDKPEIEAIPELIEKVQPKSVKKRRPKASDKKSIRGISEQEAKETLIEFYKNVLSTDETLSTSDDLIINQVTNVSVDDQDKCKPTVTSQKVILDLQQPIGKNRPNKQAKKQLLNGTRDLSPSAQKPPKEAEEEIELYKNLIGKAMIDCLSKQEKHDLTETFDKPINKVPNQLERIEKSMPTIPNQLGISKSSKNCAPPDSTVKRMPNLDMPSLDMPSLDMAPDSPSPDMPSLDMPRLDMPSLDMPNPDLPNLGMPQLQIEGAIYLDNQPISDQVKSGKKPIVKRKKKELIILNSSDQLGKIEDYAPFETSKEPNGSKEIIDEITFNSVNKQIASASGPLKLSEITDFTVKFKGVQRNTTTKYASDLATIDARLKKYSTVSNQCEKIEDSYSLPEGIKKENMSSPLLCENFDKEISQEFEEVIIDESSFDTDKQNVSDQFESSGTLNLIIEKKDDQLFDSKNPSNLPSLSYNNFTELEKSLDKQNVTEEKVAGTHFVENKPNYLPLIVVESQSKNVPNIKIEPPDKSKSTLQLFHENFAKEIMQFDAEVGKNLSPDPLQMNVSEEDEGKILTKEITDKLNVSHAKTKDIYTPSATTPVEKSNLQVNSSFYVDSVQMLTLPSQADSKRSVPNLEIQENYQPFLNKEIVIEECVVDNDQNISVSNQLAVKESSEVAIKETVQLCYENLVKEIIEESTFEVENKHSEPVEEVSNLQPTINHEVSENLTNEVISTDINTIDINTDKVITNSDNKIENVSEEIIIEDVCQNVESDVPEENEAFPTSVNLLQEIKSDNSENKVSEPTKKITIVKIKAIHVKKSPFSQQNLEKKGREKPLELSENENIFTSKPKAFIKTFTVLPVNDKRDQKNKEKAKVNDKNKMRPMVQKHDDKGKDQEHNNTKSAEKQLEDKSPPKNLINRQDNQPNNILLFNFSKLNKKTNLINATLECFSNSSPNGLRERKEKISFQEVREKCLLFSQSLLQQLRDQHKQVLSAKAFDSTKSKRQNMDLENARPKDNQVSFQPSKQIQETVNLEIQPNSIINSLKVRQELTITKVDSSLNMPKISQIHNSRELLGRDQYDHEDGIVPIENCVAVLIDEPQPSSFLVNSHFLDDAKAQKGDKTKSKSTEKINNPTFEPKQTILINSPMLQAPAAVKTSNTINSPENQKAEKVKNLERITKSIESNKMKQKAKEAKISQHTIANLLSKNDKKSICESNPIELFQVPILLETKSEKQSNNDPNNKNKENFVQVLENMFNNRIPGKDPIESSPINNYYESVLTQIDSNNDDKDGHCLNLKVTKNVCKEIVNLNECGETKIEPNVPKNDSVSSDNEVPAISIIENFHEDKLEINAAAENSNAGEKCLDIVVEAPDSVERYSPKDEVKCPDLNKTDIIDDCEFLGGNNDAIVEITISDDAIESYNESNQGVKEIVIQDTSKPDENAISTSEQGNQEVTQHNITEEIIEIKDSSKPDEIVQISEPDNLEFTPNKNELNPTRVEEIFEIPEILKPEEIVQFTPKQTGDLELPHIQEFGEQFNELNQPEIGQIIEVQDTSKPENVQTQELTQNGSENQPEEVIIPMPDEDVQPTSGSQDLKEFPQHNEVTESSPNPSGITQIIEIHESLKPDENVQPEPGNQEVQSEEGNKIPMSEDVQPTSGAEDLQEFNENNLNQMEEIAEIQDTPNEEIAQSSSGPTDREHTQEFTHENKTQPEIEEIIVEIEDTSKPDENVLSEPENQEIQSEEVIKVPTPEDVQSTSGPQELKESFENDLNKIEIKEIVEIQDTPKHEEIVQSEQTNPEEEFTHCITTDANLNQPEIEEITVEIEDTKKSDEILVSEPKNQDPIKTENFEIVDCSFIECKEVIEMVVNEVDKNFESHVNWLETDRKATSNESNQTNDYNSNSFNVVDTRCIRELSELVERNLNIKNDYAHLTPTKDYDVEKIPDEPESPEYEPIKPKSTFHNKFSLKKEQSLDLSISKKGSINQEITHKAKMNNFVGILDPDAPQFVISGNLQVDRNPQINESPKHESGPITVPPKKHSRFCFSLSNPAQNSSYLIYQSPRSSCQASACIFDKKTKKCIHYPVDSPMVSNTSTNPSTPLEKVEIFINSMTSTRSEERVSSTKAFSGSSPEMAKFTSAPPEASGDSSDYDDIPLIDRINNYKKAKTIFNTIKNKIKSEKRYFKKNRRIFGKKEDDKKTSKVGKIKNRDDKNHKYKIILPDPIKIPRVKEMKTKLNTKIDPKSESNLIKSEKSKRKPKEDKKDLFFDVGKQDPPNQEHLKKDKLLQKSDQILSDVGAYLKPSEKSPSKPKAKKIDKDDKFYISQSLFDSKRPHKNKKKSSIEKLETSRSKEKNDDSKTPTKENIPDKVTSKGAKKTKQTSKSRPRDWNSQTKDENQVEVLISSNPNAHEEKSVKSITQGDSHSRNNKISKRQNSRSRKEECKFKPDLEIIEKSKSRKLLDETEFLSDSQKVLGVKNVQDTKPRRSRSKKGEENEPKPSCDLEIIEKPDKSKKPTDCQPDSQKVHSITKDSKSRRSRSRKGPKTESKLEVSEKSKNPKSTTETDHLSDSEKLRSNNGEDPKSHRSRSRKGEEESTPRCDLEVIEKPDKSKKPTCLSDDGSQKLPKMNNADDSKPRRSRSRKSDENEPKPDDLEVTTKPESEKSLYISQTDYLSDSSHADDLYSKSKKNKSNSSTKHRKNSLEKPKNIVPKSPSKVKSDLINQVDKKIDLSEESIIVLSDYSDTENDKLLKTPVEEQTMETKSAFRNNLSSPTENLIGSKKRKSTKGKRLSESGSPCLGLTTYSSPLIGDPPQLDATPKDDLSKLYGSPKDDPPKLIDSPKPDPFTFIEEEPSPQSSYSHFKNQIKTWENRVAYYTNYSNNNDETPKSKKVGAQKRKAETRRRLACDSTSNVHSSGEDTEVVKISASPMNTPPPEYDTNESFFKSIVTGNTRVLEFASPRSYSNDKRNPLLVPEKKPKVEDTNVIKTEEHLRRSSTTSTENEDCTISEEHATQTPFQTVEQDNKNIDEDKFPTDSPDDSENVDRKDTENTIRRSSRIRKPKPDVSSTATPISREDLHHQNTEIEEKGSKCTVFDPKLPLCPSPQPEEIIQIKTYQNLKSKKFSSKVIANQEEEMDQLNSSETPQSDQLNTSLGDHQTPDSNADQKEISSTKSESNKDGKKALHKEDQDYKNKFPGDDKGDKKHNSKRKNEKTTNSDESSKKCLPAESPIRRSSRKRTTKFDPDIGLTASKSKGTQDLLNHTLENEVDKDSLGRNLVEESYQSKNEQNLNSKKSPPKAYSQDPNQNADSMEISKSDVMKPTDLEKIPICDQNIDSAKDGKGESNNDPENPSSTTLVSKEVQDSIVSASEDKRPVKEEGNKRKTSRKDENATEALKRSSETPIRRSSRKRTKKLSKDVIGSTPRVQDFQDPTSENTSAETDSKSAVKDVKLKPKLKTNPKMDVKIQLGLHTQSEENDPTKNVENQKLSSNVADRQNPIEMDEITKSDKMGTTNLNSSEKSLSSSDQIEKKDSEDKSNSTEDSGNTVSMSISKDSMVPTSEEKDDDKKEHNRKDETAANSTETLKGLTTENAIRRSRRNRKAKPSIDGSSTAATPKSRDTQDLPNQSYEITQVEKKDSTCAVIDGKLKKLKTNPKTQEEEIKKLSVGPEGSLDKGKDLVDTAKCEMKTSNLDNNEKSKSNSDSNNPAKLESNSINDPEKPTPKEDSIVLISENKILVKDQDDKKKQNSNKKDDSAQNSTESLMPTETPIRRSSRNRTAKPTYDFISSTAATPKSRGTFPDQTSENTEVKNKDCVVVDVKFKKAKANPKIDAHLDQNPAQPEENAHNRNDQNLKNKKLKVTDNQESQYSKENTLNDKIRITNLENNVKSVSSPDQTEICTIKESEGEFNSIKDPEKLTSTPISTDAQETTVSTSEDQAEKDKREQDEFHNAISSTDASEISLPTEKPIRKRGRKPKKADKIVKPVIGLTATTPASLNVPDQTSQNSTVEPDSKATGEFCSKMTEEDVLNDEKLEESNSNNNSSNEETQQTSEQVLISTQNKDKPNGDDIPVVDIQEDKCDIHNKSFPSTVDHLEQISRPDEINKGDSSDQTTELEHSKQTEIIPSSGTEETKINIEIAQTEVDNATKELQEMATETPAAQKYSQDSSDQNQVQIKNNKEVNTNTVIHTSKTEQSEETAVGHSAHEADSEIPRNLDTSDDITVEKDSNIGEIPNKETTEQIKETITPQVLQPSHNLEKSTSGKFDDELSPLGMEEKDENCPLGSGDVVTITKNPEEFNDVQHPKRNRRVNLNASEPKTKRRRLIAKNDPQDLPQLSHAQQAECKPNLESKQSDESSKCNPSIVEKLQIGLDVGNIKKACEQFLSIVALNKEPRLEQQMVEKFKKQLAVEPIIAVAKCDPIKKIKQPLDDVTKSSQNVRRRQQNHSVQTQKQQTPSQEKKKGRRGRPRKSDNKNPIHKNKAIENVRTPSGVESEERNYQGLTPSLFAIGCETLMREADKSHTANENHHQPKYIKNTFKIIPPPPRPNERIYQSFIRERQTASSENTEGTLLLSQMRLELERHNVANIDEILNNFETLIADGPRENLRRTQSSTNIDQLSESHSRSYFHPQRRNSEAFENPYQSRGRSQFRRTQESASRSRSLTVRPSTSQQPEDIPTIVIDSDDDDNKDWFQNYQRPSWERNSYGFSYPYSFPPFSTLPYLPPRDFREPGAYRIRGRSLSISSFEANSKHSESEDCYDSDDSCPRISNCFSISDHLYEDRTPQDDNWRSFTRTQELQPKTKRKRGRPKKQPDQADDFTKTPEREIRRSPRSYERRQAERLNRQSIRTRSLSRSSSYLNLSLSMTLSETSAITESETEDHPRSRSISKTDLRTQYDNRVTEEESAPKRAKRHRSRSSKRKFVDSDFEDSMEESISLRGRRRTSKRKYSSSESSADEFTSSKVKVNYNAEEAEEFDPRLIPSCSGYSSSNGRENSSSPIHNSSEARPDHERRKKARKRGRPPRSTHLDFGFCEEFEAAGPTVEGYDQRLIPARPLSTGPCLPHTTSGRTIYVQSLKEARKKGRSPKSPKDLGKRCLTEENQRPSKEETVSPDVENRPNTSTSELPV